MRAYSNIEQSKKLLEILSPNTADMYYEYILPKSDKIKHIPSIGNPVESLEWFNKGYTAFGISLVTLDEYCIPCWSLTALIDILPRIDIEKESWSDDTYDYRVKAYIDDGYIGDWFDNPVDACYDMIITLNKDKLL